MIRAVIFDFAGVVVKDGYWEWLEKVVSNLDAKHDYFLELSDKVDSGQTSHKIFLEELAVATKVPQDEIWNQVSKYFILNQELVSLIKELGQEYKIGLLSNFTAPWIHKLLTQFDLYSLFDKIIVSSEHKIIKPNEKIFQKMLGEFEIKPHEAIFIDDRERHINGASSLGIHGILFTTTQKLKDDLQKVM